MEGKETQGAGTKDSRGKMNRVEKSEQKRELSRGKSPQGRDDDVKL